MVGGYCVLDFSDRTLKLSEDMSGVIEITLAEFEHYYSLKKPAQVKIKYENTEETYIVEGFATKMTCSGMQYLVLDDMMFTAIHGTNDNYLFIAMPYGK